MAGGWEWMAASVRYRSRRVLSGLGAVRIVPDDSRLDNGRTMGHWLSKIYTRTGDWGETGLGVAAGSFSPGAGGLPLNRLDFLRDGAALARKPGGSELYWERGRKGP